VSWQYGIWALAICGMAAAAGAAERPIRARVKVVRPSEPGQLEVYVTVTPQQANRGYEAIAYCDGMEVLRSYRPLAGLTSEGPFHPIVWRNVPGCAGPIAIAVTLLGAGDRPIGYAEPQVARVLCARCEAEAEADAARGGA
jgi:hypothetical protein